MKKIAEPTLADALVIFVIFLLHTNAWNTPPWFFRLRFADQLARVPDRRALRWNQTTANAANAWRWETDTSMPSQRVTRIIQRIIDHRGAPEFIRSDNGPEVSSRHYLAWCVERNIGTIHIQPGKPTQNAHVESFHARFRDECLNASWFWNLWDARRKISGWRNEYNRERPHSALGYRTPEEFAQQWAHAASPSAFRDTTPPKASQGQALRAPAAALTPPRLRGQTFHQEGDAGNYAARFCIT